MYTCVCHRCFHTKVTDSNVINKGNKEIHTHTINTNFFPNHVILIACELKREDSMVFNLLNRILLNFVIFYMNLGAFKNFQKNAAL